MEKSGWRPRLTEGRVITTTPPPELLSGRSLRERELRFCHSRRSRLYRRRWVPRTRRRSSKVKRGSRPQVRGIIPQGLGDQDQGRASRNGVLREEAQEDMGCHPGEAPPVACLHGEDPPGDLEVQVVQACPLPGPWDLGDPEDQACHLGGPVLQEEEMLPSPASGQSTLHLMAKGEFH